MATGSMPSQCRVAAVLAAALALAASGSAAGRTAAADVLPGTALTLGGSAFTGAEVVHGLLQLPLLDTGSGPGSGLGQLQVEGATAPTEGNGFLQGGLGYRHGLADGLLLGGSAFLGYDLSTAGSGFWTASTGLELLTPAWQLSGNLYLPLGDRTVTTGPATWAGETGDTGYTGFRGHQHLDRLVAPVDQVGPGADLAAGVRLLPEHGLRLSLGGYHFDQQVEDRSGITGGLEAAIGARLTAALGAAHDDVEGSRVGLALTFRFGGAPPGSTAGSGAWRHRPVQRNQAGLGRANSLPVTETVAPVSGDLVYRDNVWFFDPAGAAFDAGTGGANCTAERPCADLGEATTAAIAGLSAAGGAALPPALYLRSGTYSLPAGAPLVLFDNQSLFGRGRDYAMAASGADRPTIESSGLFVSGGNGNSANRIENLVLAYNGGASFGGIFGSDAGRLQIRNVVVGTPAGASRGGFGFGVQADGATQVHLADSVIDMDNGGIPAIETIGIRLLDEATLLLEDSRVTATARGDGDQSAVALQRQGNGTMTVRRSSLTGTAAGRTTGLAAAIADQSPATAILAVEDSLLAASISGAPAGTAAAMELPGGSTVTLRNSLLSVVALDGATAAGMTDGGIGNGRVAIENSRIDLNASGTNGAVFGLVFGGSSISTLSGSQVTASHAGTGDSNLVTAVTTAGSAQLTVTGSTLSGSDSSTGGIAAATTFQAGDDSRLVIRDSVVISAGSAAVQSGNTNITTADRAQAVVEDSILVTRFAGGPTITESSGAVPLWSLGSSSIRVLRSEISAIAGNALTAPPAVEAQDASTVTILDSDLQGVQANGNRLDQNLSLIVAADSAEVAIGNTSLLLSLAGPAEHGMNVVVAQGGSRVTLTGGVLAGDNGGLPNGPQALPTIGAFAFQNSAVALQGVQILLSGGAVRPSATEGAGTVTIGD